MLNWCLKMLERHALHPTISEDQISDLVEIFYGKIQADDRLGPLFTQFMSADWDTHLETMKRFWRSVMLKTGEYKGKPVPAHTRMHNIRSEDFERWLTLFHETATAIFHPEAALLAYETAIRIAHSLWLACYPDPFAQTPIWVTNPPGIEKENERKDTCDLVNC